MKELKTLGTMLQEVVEKEEKRYSLHEFLLESTDEERKQVETKLSEEDYKQFYEYMDGFSFVNETEVNMAIVEYFEKVNDRPVCMWEMWDLSEVADDYMREKNLNFEDD